MIDSTPNLNLPILAAGQAQKHITLNDALLCLDSIVQLSVKTRNLERPPASSIDGDRYIVAALASGAWSGKEGQIAVRKDGDWIFHQPGKGWLGWVMDEELIYCFNGDEWIAHQNGITQAELAVDLANGAIQQIGVNTNADTSNRLSVKSGSILFSHDDASENGDVQAKLNKSAADKTASVLFQSQWSGRAEIGLTGDDHLHIKVSDDGEIWRDAVVIDKGTGRVGIGAGSPSAPLHISGGPIRNNASAPGIWFDEADEQGCMIVLNGRRFDIQRRASGFGAYEGVIMSLDIDAPTNSIKATADGLVSTAGPLKPMVCTVADAPSASQMGKGATIFVEDESNGSIPAFSDGVNWRRMSDREIIS